MRAQRKAAKNLPEAARPIPKLPGPIPQLCRGKKEKPGKEKREKTKKIPGYFRIRDLVRMKGLEPI